MTSLRGRRIRRHSIAFNATEAPLLSHQANSNQMGGTSASPVSIPRSSLGPKSMSLGASPELDLQDFRIELFELPRARASVAEAAIGRSYAAPPSSDERSCS